MIFSAFVGLILLLAVVVNGEKLEQHSFEAPFEEVDHSGQKIVGKHWRQFGTTVVNNNFIRLTPDRQSKKGAIWSRKALGVPEFSSILKFRISGQGKNFFGDGIGFWITDQPYYTEGNLHGFTDKFVGIGIIFDTFKNTESLHAHRDVTVLVNDGEKTYDMMTENVMGCNTNVRYHSERGDFSVKDASRAKVLLNQKSLTIEIDNRNTGEWVGCVNINNLTLPDNFVLKAHIGVTATTGQLADNHDVLSLMSFSDSSVMETEDLKQLEKVSFETASAMGVADRLLRLEQAMSKVLDQQSYFDEHIEHELVSVEDHIANLKAKIEKREDSADLRIDELEKLVKKEVDGSLNGRLNQIERQIRDDINRKLTKIDEALRKLKINVDDTGSTVVKVSGEWKTPFMVLVGFLVVACIGLFFFYQHLLKKWKLP